jgi:hypothetical protein
MLILKSPYACCACRAAKLTSDICDSLVGADKEQCITHVVQPGLLQMS